MINFLRGVRQQSLNENSSDSGQRKGKYAFYAVGEIVLVVIGILIAMQINNWNYQKKERDIELRYLSNIKKDLSINIQEIEKFLEIRTESMDNAKTILGHFEGIPITDAAEFNEMAISMYDWKRFYQNNNTFQELTFSGNLRLISNEAIKTLLFNIESIYKVNTAEEDHFRYDTEALIYEPLYQLMDLKALVESSGFPLTNDDGVKSAPITPDIYKDYLTNIKAKNGFAMAALEFYVMNKQLKQMKQMSEELIELIDEEIEKG